jgi:hypothetical protein
MRKLRRDETRRDETRRDEGNITCEAAPTAPHRIHPYSQCTRETRLPLEYTAAASAGIAPSAHHPSILPLIETRICIARAPLAVRRTDIAYIICHPFDHAHDAARSLLMHRARAFMHACTHACTHVYSCRNDTLQRGSYRRIAS